MVKGPDPLDTVERVAFAEEVSSVTRHEARNKLAAARNAATYIRRRLSQADAWRNDPRVQTFHELMENELHGVSELLDPRELLGHVFARQVERADAAACVREAVDRARIAESARVAVRVDAAPCEVTVDRRELALAVRCLVENAVEATADELVRTVSVIGRCVDRWYAIEVSDGGPGIDEAHREEASRPFFSTKPGHAGLGLNIARRLARRLGGDLTLGTSGLGGLQATLRLPCNLDGDA
jgi:signal transduction histidine kinase